MADTASFSREDTTTSHQLLATLGNCNNYAKNRMQRCIAGEQRGRRGAEEGKKRRRFQGTERKRSNARQDGGGDGMQKRLRR